MSVSFSSADINTPFYLNKNFSKQRARLPKTLSSCKQLTFTANLTRVTTLYNKASCIDNTTVGCKNKSSKTCFGYG